MGSEDAIDSFELCVACTYDKESEDGIKGKNCFFYIGNQRRDNDPALYLFVIESPEKELI